MIIKIKLYLGLILLAIGCEEVKIVKQDEVKVVENTKSSYKTHIIHIVSDTTQKETIKKNYKIEYSLDSTYTEFVEGLELIHNENGIDRDTISGQLSCNIDFDNYFKLFDKLKIKKNWVLESHYRNFGSAGRPLILAFEKGSKMADSLGLELNKKTLRIEDQSWLDWEVSQKLFHYIERVDYMNYIEIEDSKMGYFQFAVFYLTGDNYCRSGHSLNSDMSIITSKDQIKYLVNMEKNMYYNFTNEDKKIIKKINPTPTIEIQKEKAIVILTTLDPWQGFRISTFEIKRNWPHRIERVKTDTLLDYDCGFHYS